MVERLGIRPAGEPGTTASRDDAELAALESGEAARNVESELEKAEKLRAKYQPGSDEHRMLSRRVLMLKRLKEKLRE